MHGLWEAWGTWTRERLLLIEEVLEAAKGEDSKLPALGF
jgi:hypothetical protein